MSKKVYKVFVFIVAVFMVSIFVLPSSNIYATENAQRVNMLASKANWVISQGNGSTVINDGQMDIISVGTPAVIGTSGSVYNTGTYAGALIEFDFQIEYGMGVEPYTEEDESLPDTFFGIIFLNNVEVANVTSDLACPWDVQGGYPYMLAFDTERAMGEKNRYDQVGLTLRRYNERGSHDYVRWATVNPTNETFINSVSQSYESKIPNEYRPIKVSDIWDGQKHSVSLEFKPLYKSAGDEYDAIQIKVVFDGELAMLVIDEMPFMGEELGTEFPIDKRDDGYISVFQYHDSTSPSLDYYSYKLTYSNFYITPYTQFGGTGNPGDTNGNSPQKCNSMLIANNIPYMVIIFSLVYLVVATTKKIKSRSAKGEVK